MERKSFALEIKNLGDAGEFVGLASVYGNVDLHGDIVERGAFAKTIAAKGREIPLLWQHRMDMPIGLGRLEDSEAGLMLHGQLTLDVALARECYALMKARVVKGLSIGYDTVSEKADGQIRRLLEIDLWEVSCVTFPANPLAQVTSVKEIAALARELKEGRVLSATNLRKLQEALAALTELLAAAAPPVSEDPPADLPADPADGGGEKAEALAADIKAWLDETKSAAIAAR